MSDLISRQHLLDDMLHDLSCYEIEDKDKENIYLPLADVERMIKGQPTAYDVDKVLQELKATNSFIFHAIESREKGIYKNKSVKIEIAKLQAMHITMSNAIEIVQKGGIS